MRSILACVLLAACGDGVQPLAGRLTHENLDGIVPGGETAAGRPGDYYLRNEHATFIVQRPGRELAIGPYGGALVDVALTGGRDGFGELIPALALSRTIHITDMEMISDGSDGGRAVIEGFGNDATNVYYNLEGLSPALLSFEEDGTGILGHDPVAPMDLAVHIRYALEPGAPHLSITYTFTNEGDKRIGIPLGFILDARANGEPYMPGLGFAADISKSLDEDNIGDLLAYNRTTSQMAWATKDVAMTFIPLSLGGERPRPVAAQIPSLGSGMLINARSVAGAAKEASFRLRPGESVEFQMDVVAAETIDQALMHGWRLLDQPLAETSGCVHLDTGEPAIGVRVGLLDAAGEPTTVFTTGDDGCFIGAAPPGHYRAIAGSTYRPISAEVELDVPGPPVDLTLPALSAVDVRVGVLNRIDATTPGRHACRVSLIGARTTITHPALNGEVFDDPGGVIARQRLLRHCEGLVEVPPGRYLAVVTRGPEFDFLEQVVDVTDEVATVRGVLHRVVDSRGYAASDLHVHSVYSPDSRVPAQERVISMAAEGMDFWASTDHDVVADFAPVIFRMGLADELLTVPGSEVTTFDLGHFNAYPLVRDPLMANGDSPDWAPRDDGRRPLFQELFDDFHARGALVQVNHPRSGGINIGAYFSRSGMAFDAVTRQAYADPAQQPLANEYLRYEPGVAYFSADFDVIEVMNGISTYVRNGMVYDRGVERAGHDWMNFLSGGRRMVAVANSDTHTTAKPPGTARTLIGGHDAGVAGIVAAIRRGDAVLSTGPMVRATLLDPAGGSAGPGDVLTATGSSLVLRVHVETPAWYVADRVEVIANVFFADPTSGGEAPAALPLITLMPVEVPRANGGQALVASADIPIDLDAAPFNEGDGWLAVRVGGPSSMLYPAMRGGGGTVDDSAETPEAFLSNRHGVKPFAQTNAIFIDMDGDGAWH